MPSRVKKERSLLVQMAWSARRRASRRGMARKVDGTAVRRKGGTTRIPLPYRRTDYSYLNASTGSSRAALVAG